MPRSSSTKGDAPKPKKGSKDILSSKTGLQEVPVEELEKASRRASQNGRNAPEKDL